MEAYSLKKLKRFSRARKNVATSTVPELHERMVVAVARKYKVPLISNDSEIIKSSEVSTIWD